MSEADLREGLRAAVGDEPPLTFDPDELIQRAQHARRRRRALVAVAVATLALTGTVLSLPGVVNRRPGIDAATGPVLTTTASPSSRASNQAPAVTPQLPPLGPPRNGADLRTAYASHLTKRFTELVPGRKVVAAEFSDDAPKEPGLFVGWLNFLDGEGSSQVFVRLIPAPPVGRTMEEFCAQMGCAAPVRLADGTSLASISTSNRGAGSRYRSESVVHFRADGSTVEVTTYNYDPNTGESVRPSVALGYDQLVALATDPKLAAF